MKYLAIALANGFGVAQNKAEAVDWFRKAAKGGNVDATVALGLMLEQGDGVPRNLPEAMDWLLLAKENGNTRAAQLYDALAGEQASRNVAASNAGTAPSTPSVQARDVNRRGVIEGPELTKRRPAAKPHRHAPALRRLGRWPRSTQLARRSASKPTI